MESLSNHPAMLKLPNSLASKAWQVLSTKTSQILTQRPPVAITVPSGPTVIEALVHWVYHRICDPGLSNPATFLGLCFLRWLQAGNSVSRGRAHLQLYRRAEKALRFTIYDYLFRLRQKDVIFDEIYPLNWGLNYLTISTESAKSINRLTAVKGLMLSILMFDIEPVRISCWKSTYASTGERSWLSLVRDVEKADVEIC